MCELIQNMYSTKKKNLFYILSVTLLESKNNSLFNDDNYQKRTSHLPQATIVSNNSYFILVHVEQKN